MAPPSSIITSVNVNSSTMNASTGTFDNIVCSSGSFTNLTVTNACLISISYVTITSVSHQYVYGEVDALNISCA